VLGYFCFTVSDPGMESAFFDTLQYQEFAKLEVFSCVPGATPSCAFATGW